jgi:hypothetical protein
LQDTVSRITVDTASSFLFGQDVRSLDAGLHYVAADATKNFPAAHPSSTFANAFQEAQTITSLRTRFGDYEDFLFSNFLARVSQIRFDAKS